MTVRERSNTRLVIETFTWDVALVTGALFGVPLVFVVIGVLSDGEFLIVPFVVSALAGVLFAVYAGRRLIVFETTENRIRLQFQSVMRKKQVVRRLSDLQRVKLTGSFGEKAPVDLDPNALPQKRYRYTATLVFLEEPNLIVSQSTMLFSSAPEIVRTLQDWIRKSAS